MGITKIRLVISRIGVVITRIGPMDRDHVDRSS